MPVYQAQHHVAPDKRTTLVPSSGSRVYQLRTFAAVDKLRPKSNHAHYQLSHRATVDNHVDTRSPRYAVYRPRTRYEVDKPFSPPVLTGMPDYQPQHNVEVDNPGPVDRSPSFGPRWDSNRTCCCSHCSAPAWEALRTLAVSVWGSRPFAAPSPCPAANGIPDTGGGRYRPDPAWMSEGGRRHNRKRACNQTPPPAPSPV